MGKRIHARNGKLGFLSRSVEWLLFKLRPTLTGMEPTMLRSTQRFFSYYANYYWDYLVEVWNKMTPMSYGILLVCIGIFGWLLMKGSLKKC